MQLLLNMQKETNPEAQEVKQIRKALGLNTEKFGALFGVSKRTVEAWEYGRRKCKGAAWIMIQKMKEEGYA